MFQFYFYIRTVY